MKEGENRVLGCSVRVGVSFAKIGKTWLGLQRKKLGGMIWNIKKKNNVGVLVSSVRGKVMLTTRIPSLHVSPIWKGSRLKTHACFAGLLL